MVGEMMERELRVVPPLAGFGYAPGNYACVCMDCPDAPAAAPIPAANRFRGAKHSNRCEMHAKLAKERYEKDLNAGEHQFNFGHAICLMRAGSRVKRRGHTHPIEMQFEPEAKIVMMLGGEAWTWNPTQEAVLANDWMVA